MRSLSEVNYLLSYSDEALEEKCFVCGIDDSRFLEVKKSFETHVSVEHEIWNYLYYLFYLKSKGETELDGDELSVWSCLRGDSTDFMPEGNTKYLDKVILLLISARVL